MRILIFIILFQWTNFGLRAQDNSGGQALLDAIAKFNATTTSNELNTLLVRFDQLAQTTTTANAWVPSYYLALINARLSLKNNKGKEEYADKAVYWANKSIAIQANDENYCILSMAKTAKMAVNPFLRWVTYEKSIYAPLALAKKTNPNNPRIYILEGSLTLKMPSMFGGGCDKAKPTLKKAQDLLDKQISQKILPIWGKQTLDELKQSCPF
jgi:hypothetical protein